MKRSNPLVARAVALLTSVALVVGLVPVPSLAEAVAEAEGQEQTSVEETALLGADGVVGEDEVGLQDAPAADDGGMDGATELSDDVTDVDSLAQDGNEEALEIDASDAELPTEDAGVDAEGEEVVIEEVTDADEVAADDKVQEAADDAGAIEESDKGAADAKDDSGASDVLSKRTLSAKDAKTAAKPVVTYQACVQNTGWLDPVKNGKTAGIVGQDLGVEALHATLAASTTGGIKYRAYVQNSGWQDWARNGEDVGSAGSGLRVEAFSMRLTGAIAKEYDVYYRARVERFGWLKWARNGAASGTVGMSLRLEAFQVRLVAKGAAAPSSKKAFHLAAIHAPKLQYRGRIESIDWQGWKNAGKTAGTSKRSLRIESIQTRIRSTKLTGALKLKAHVQNIGWQSGWKTTSGTWGQGLRIEALRAKLTGDLAKYFDVYYRVHVQNIGWMGWAKNGQKAGTTAMGMRVEAVQMRLVLKGSPAVGKTSKRFIDGNTVGKMGYQNPAGFYQVSSKNVKITSAATYPWNYVTPSRIGVWATRQDCINAFIGRAREYLGTPYVWDYSCAPGVGVDCIGLVYQCAYACGMDLGGGTGYDDFNPWAHWTSGSSGWHSHDANNFWDYGNVMHVSLADRQVGDLISWAGHVAIYLGDDTIIEAYPGSVMYNSLWAHGTPRGCMRLFQ